MTNHLHHFEEIYSLSYISTPNISPNRKTIESTFYAFNKINQDHNITGILVISPNFYWQTIEGSLRELTILYNNIKADLNHFNIKLIHDCHKITKRAYSRWNLKIVNLSVDEFDKTDLLLYDIITAIYNLYDISHKIIPNCILSNLISSREHSKILKSKAYNNNTCKIILYSNILQYLSFAHNLHPNELYLWMSNIHQIFINCNIKYGGIVTSILGDCAIAIFDYNETNHSKILHKVIDCAVDYQMNLKQFRSSLTIAPHNITYAGISIFYEELNNYNIEDIMRNNSEKTLMFNSWINVSKDIADNVTEYPIKKISCAKYDDAFEILYETHHKKKPLEASEQINEWIKLQSNGCKSIYTLI
jgi:hypothetical protein